MYGVRHHRHPIDTGDVHRPSGEADAADGADAGIHDKQDGSPVQSPAYTTGTLSHHSSTTAWVHVFHSCKHV